MSWVNANTWIHHAPTILFALLAVAVLARAMFVPQDVRRESCCGACQHPVSDLDNERCNECGGLFRKVGIVTPGLAVRFRAYLPLALLAWTAICGAITSVGIAQAQRYAFTMPAPPPKGPVIAPFELDMELRPQNWMNGLGKVDAKKLNFRVEVSVTASLKDDVVDTGTMLLTIRKSGTKEWVKIDVDLSDGSFRIALKDGSLVAEGEAFTGEQTKIAFDALELDSAYKPVATAMADITRIFEITRDDPEGLTTSFDMTQATGPGSLQMHSSTGGMRNYTYLPGMMAPTGPRSIWTLWQVKAGAAVLAPVYLIGLGFIAWRHRRLVRN